MQIKTFSSLLMSNKLLFIKQQLYFHLKFLLKRDITYYEPCINVD